jgi:hypothetical protein
MLLEDIKKIKSTKKELREFGLIVGAVFGLLATLFLWRGKSFYLYFYTISIFLVLFGLIAPVVLKPIQKIWMILAIVFSFFVTRIILGILFYLVITPVGIIMKISGKDILNITFNDKSDSYWIKRNNQNLNKESYEKQY